MKKVMAVNCGSSSVKFKLYEMPEETVICSGIVERIGHDDAIFTIKYEDKKDTVIIPVKDHAVAVENVLNALIEKSIIKSLDDIKAVGHRVVQGGAYFDKSEPWNDDTYSKVESLIPLAPLHNKAHLVGYNAFKKVLPSVPQIAVFDTAFHQSMDAEDYTFPIPYEYTEKYQIRRYGAHGTSHKYLSQEGRKYLENPENDRMIICHLGSGASITATRHGKCVATSMGLTPLGGIMVNTRTGDMDPSVFYQIQAMTGKGYEEIFQEMNKKSGLLGVSGISNDSRDVENAAKNGDPRAILAIKLWARRIADYIGQYYVRLGGCDLIIFSAGIGENSSEFREAAIRNIEEALNVRLDEEANKNTNRGKEGIISLPSSKIKIVVIPTDEEVMIARDAYDICLK